VDWTLTSRGNERIVAPAFPAIRDLTTYLLILSSEIRDRIQARAISDISLELMAQSERVEQFRDLLMASVKTFVFGKQSWRELQKKLFPKSYRRWCRSVEDRAMYTAVTILGKEEVQRLEKRRQEINERYAGVAGRKEQHK
jgi:hypothetical protein